MDTNNNMQNMDGLVFECPKNQTSYIKVIGVGGGGNNAVNHMFRQGISGVDFIVCNTDKKALATSPVPNKIMLGNGMGAGNNPEVARAAAEDKSEELRNMLKEDTKMLFIAAGMGGGTGTGAAPVIAKLAKEIELQDGYTKRILVVAIVTMPFFFEGMKRMKQAMAGLEELRKHVDSVLVINNDKLLKKGNLPLPQAYALADDVLLTAARGISEIITVNSYINIDFEDVNAVMAGSGTALMGVGVGEGENRAKDAIEKATTSELLNDNDISGAKDILLYISYSESNVITVDELSEITDHMTRLTGSTNTNVIWGQGVDDSLTEEIKITLIATGFEAKKNDSREIHKLDDVKSKSIVNEIKKEGVEDPLTVVTNKPNAERRVLLLDETSADRKPAGEHIPGAISFKFGEHSQESADDGMQLVHKDKPVVNVTSNTDMTFHAAVQEEAEAAVEEEPLTYRVEKPTAMAIETMSLHTDVQEPASVQVETPSLSPEMKSTAEERIKRMHDLLHNNPMGPKIAEQMLPSELMGDVNALPPLSESDMPTTYLGSDGKMCSQDGYLDNPAD